jgi:hypothetical protein
MKKEILSVGVALVLGGTVVPARALFEDKVYVDAMTGKVHEIK